MSRQYHEPVAVTLANDKTLERFTWRGKTYHVKTVLATWHLQDQWWSPEGTDGAATAIIAVWKWSSI